MPTPAWSELERLLPGRVRQGAEERAAFGADLWPLALARERRGDRRPLPGAVVRPGSAEDVCRLLAWCSRRGVAVLPCGGRSGVCGGVAVDPQALGGREAVALDLRSLAGVEVAPGDLRARVLAGTMGHAYEAALEARGLTGGHHPQSLYLSTVGGWLACRSAGQLSTRYGKAEDMVVGLGVVLASGELLRLGPHPATAAGPDLWRLFLGSEGTLGVIVEATLRVSRRGERRFRAFRFPSFGAGVGAVREVVQRGLRPAVVRLYDEADTAWSFPGEEGCLLVTVFEGPLAGEEEAAGAAVLAAEGEDLGAGPARWWFEHRFDAVEQYRAVMRPDGPLGPHALVDTVEVAGAWSGLEGLYASVRAAVGPHCLGVVCHLSHAYPDGACLYFTLAIAGSDDAEAERRYWGAWEGAMEAALGQGATITHHHGVGRLKAPWLRRELGEEGWRLLRGLKVLLDPEQILNPGNLGL